LAAKKGYPEYAEKTATAEHAYRPYSWTTGKATAGKGNAKPRATSATAGRRPAGPGGMDTAAVTWGRPFSATDGKAQSRGPPGGGGGGGYHGREDKNEDKLAAMYSEDVIRQLDTAFAPKR
jgi:hypothetical protein